MHSEPTERLLADARAYARAGVRELVLVAQDSTAYGEDRGDRDGLAALLERLSAEVPDVPWIRLMYAYPGRVTPRLAETMAALPNVVPYLDIPLQHGSDAVLKRMRRPGLRTARRSLETIRAAMPDLAVRTTFIVGFPGETDAEFEELLDFVEEQEFDHLGAFTYSPQTGTPAADLAEAVPHEVATERYGMLMELAQQISHERNQAQVGRELEVLVESNEPTPNAAGDPGRRRAQLPRRARGRRPRVRTRRVRGRNDAARARRRRTAVRLALLARSRRRRGLARSQPRPRLSRSRTSFDLPRRIAGNPEPGRY